MNKDKCKQLWITVNKLRGTMSVEAIVRAMIYSLLLKYIEGKHKSENAFMFYDEKYSVDYLSLTYGKMISAEDLRNYLSMTEKEIGINNGIISDGLFTMFSSSESEKIRLILNAMEAVDPNSYRDYYEIAGFLIEQLALRNGKTSGEYLTNSSVAKLIGKILDCKTGMTLYDGFCGCGILANQIAAGNCSVYLQDISPITVSIAAVMTVFCGAQIKSVCCGDSLLNPIDCTTKYDRVVLDPPLGIRYDPEYMKSIPIGNCFEVVTEDRDSVYVRHAIAHMKEDGMAAVIVPMGLLFRSGRSAEVRKEFASQYVDAVIELPGGTIPSTGAATAILILKKKNPDDGIFMINAKEFTERAEKTRTDITSDGIDEIVRIYRNREVIEGISNTVSHEKLLENEYNMCTTPYVFTQTSGYDKESVIPYIKKYDELSAEVSEIDSRLTDLRERFCK